MINCLNCDGSTHNWLTLFGKINCSTQKNETAQISLSSYLSSFYFLSAEEQLVKSQLFESQLLNITCAAAKRHVQQ